MTYVAVVGPGAATPAQEVVAVELGALLADRGCVVLCGGLGGVMGAVARGARSREGVVVGLLPGTSRSDAGPDLTVALPTGLGELRNGLLVRSADVVVAVGGSWGTLSEVALAVRTGVPVVTVGGWVVTDADGAEVEGVHRVGTAAEAVAVALALGGRTARA